MKYMFQPLQIGPMTVNNRYVVPPMSNNFAIATGELSDRSLAYYCERAKGGFGLITIDRNCNRCHSVTSDTERNWSCN